MATENKPAEVPATKSSSTKSNDKEVPATPESAVQGFLQGTVDEDQLRAALGSQRLTIGANGSRVDDAYLTKIPDDLFEPLAKDPDIKERLKMVEDKEKEREESRKETEKEVKEAQPVKVVS